MNNMNKFIVQHYIDVIMVSIASQITSLTIVYSSVYSGPDQRKHQSSASLAFVRGIHRSPVISPHKGPVTRKMLPFDDVIMRPTIKQHPTKQCAHFSELTVWLCWNCYYTPLCILFFVSEMRRLKVNRFQQAITGIYLSYSVASQLHNHNNNHIGRFIRIGPTCYRWISRSFKFYFLHTIKWTNNWPVWKEKGHSFHYVNECL